MLASEPAAITEGHDRCRNVSADARERPTAGDSQNTSRADWRRRLVAAPVALTALGPAHSCRAANGRRYSCPLVPSRCCASCRIRNRCSIDELKMLADAQRSGQLWLADGRLRTDLGLAYLLLAEKLPRGDTNAGAYLQRAIEALKAGLARAPANPYAWARLAYAEALAHGWSPLAMSSLRLSLITAPYEPRLLWSRLRMTVSRLAGDVERGPTKWFCSRFASPGRPILSN